VQDIQPDISGNSVNAVCKPIVDPSSVKDVFVITNFSSKQANGGTSSSSATSNGGK
jgi:rod shape-determining protein MreC